MRNNERVVEPKVYGMLLESRETNFLSIQYAHSLEEAYVLAKIEFETILPERKGFNNPLIGSKIGLFSVKTIKELTTQPNQLDMLLRKQEMTKREKPNHNLITASEEVKTDPLSQKNVLMQEIIKNKDIEKLRKNKDVFTKSERDYIRALIKPKVK